ncbi:MAG: DUF6713 family protein [Bermanella sp.]
MQRQYFITMTALLVHQIDAAFWHEWDMFLLPGGIQGFLLFNILIIPLVLFGHQQVILNTPKAALYAYLCAGLGIITFVIHLGFYLFGFDEFMLPLSWAVLITCLISGSWLMLNTWQFTINRSPSVNNSAS